MKVITIYNCSSCGENHIGLEVFRNPDGDIYPWYTNCPDTTERIYIKEDE